MNAHQSNTLTEFNSNAATLERVDRILRLAADSSANGDIQSHYRWIDSLKREVIVKIKHDKDDEGNCKKLCPYCFCMNEMMLLGMQVIGLQSSTNRKSNAFEISKNLDRMEIWIRQVMNDKGMLLRDSESAMQRFVRGGQ